jgi:hypothetical protein
VAAFYAATMFVSALLLFLVQPMIGKMILPLLGGTPAVWNTCMVFFQALLLAGYAYAHVTTQKFGPRRQSHWHVLVLVVPLVALAATALFVGEPVHVVRSLAPQGTAYPFFGVVALLTVTIGLPFFVVSATAPLLQRWFADTDHRDAADPYFLYGASNLGSLLALAVYPALLEPTLRLSQQGWLWAVGYLGLAGLIVSCVRRLQTAAHTKKLVADAGPPPTWATRGRWVLLAFVPASLLLGTTTFATTDIAPIPLLWVIPLALYLATFIIAFGRHPKWVPTVTGMAAPALLLLAVFMMAWGKKLPRFWMTLGLHFLVFFTATLMCHLELVRLRPSGKRSTEFYLWMSLGGVLGGLFNALVAPLVFKDLTEYPIAMILACFLVPDLTTEGTNERKARAIDLILPAAIFVLILLLSRLPVSLWFLRWPATTFNIAPENLWALLALGFPALIVYYGVDRPVRFGLGVAAFWFAATIGNDMRNQDGTIYRDRSFFGKLEVENEILNEGEEGERRLRRLVHGTTLHGKQQYQPPSPEPLTYYHRTGPLGQIFAALPRLQKGEIAAIGLGTGSVAAYGAPGNAFTFYEIDPTVRRIAENPEFFTYLRDTKAGRLDFVMGDARLKIEEHGKPGQYGLIIVDAFSSDAIPIHLLTKEAVALYVSRLSDDGIIALHLSNRYLNLHPIVARIAEELGLAGLQIFDGDQNQPGKQRSNWVILARKPEHFGSLPERPDKMMYEGQTIELFDSSNNEGRWKKLEPEAGMPLWTDDFSNILSVLSW